MALNVALPLSGLLPEVLLERYALFSPLPQDFDDLELLVTPYESSESGIGSSNENKENGKSSSEDDDEPSESSASSTSSESPTPRVKSEPTSPISTVAKIRPTRIQYQGRDVLDLARNLTDDSWKFQYAVLPDNNIATFMANRSQYHRLGANGLIREYDLAPCNKCTFQFPVNSPDIISNNDGATSGGAIATHTNNHAIAKRQITRSNDKAQTNSSSFKMYKHF